MSKETVKKLIIVLIFVTEPIFTVLLAKPTALFLINAEPQVQLYSMGSIFSSVKPGEALFAKPWLLGKTVNYGLSFAQWPGVIETSRYNYACAVLPPSKLGALNISYLNYSAGEEKIEEAEGTIRDVKLEEDHLVSLGCGTSVLQRIFCGLSVKYLVSALAEEYRSSSLLLDAGIVYHTLDDRHSLGISVNNYCPEGGGVIYNKAVEPLPTEIKFGYSHKVKFKFFPATHKMLLGTAFSTILNKDDYSISAGFEYSPGLSFISLRGGVKYRNNGDLQYTAGLGINIKNLGIDIGYGVSSVNLEQNKTPLRFSVNLLFGPIDEYSIAEAYLKRKGMRDKALALWKNILPGEPQYAKAQKAIKLYMYPPELVVSAKFFDDTKDGILSAGENGSVVITITNNGKSEAINVKTELIPAEPQKVYNNLEISAYEKLIKLIEPRKSAEVAVPVKAKIDAEKVEVPFNITVTEGRDFNPQPVKFVIATKPFPSPIPLLGKYTFREDNTGNSIGNGNGTIEKGEQVELTGYVINAGETVAKDVVAQIESSDAGIEILPGWATAKLGDISPRGYKKVVFVFRIKDDYAGSKKLPLTVKLLEQRPKYNRIQQLDLAINKFYQDPVQPLFEDIDTISIVSEIPLPGPIPGSRAKEIIQAKTGRPPEIVFSTQLSGDANNNGVYEPNEELKLYVQIRNVGEGVAKGVKVVLSGDETITSLLGKSVEVGDIEPGKMQPVVLKNIVPENVPRKEAVFKVKVFESRGFSSTTIPELRVALMPKEVKIVKELPKLVPWPVANRGQRTNAAALVVGISNYKNVDKLKYAQKDAELVASYLNGVVGIPEKNIHKVFDDGATKSVIESEINEWLTQKNFEFIVFYFAGHGIPDQSSAEPFIIPYDGNMDLRGTLIPLNDIITKLENSAAKDVLLILDACFSGAGGRTPQLLAQRGIAVVPKVVQKRAIVLSATSKRQPSLEFEKAGHGYFTYYFLLGLKGEADENHDGAITLREVFNYVKNSLEEELGDKQTPTCSNISELQLGRYK